METIPSIIIVKQYLLATIFAFLGGVAHAIQKIKTAGWKGWVSFSGDIFVCIFFGQVFYQVGLLWDPKYAIVLTSLGSFWGAKSFEYLKDWIINAARANLK